MVGPAVSGVHACLRAAHPTGRHRLLPADGPPLPGERPAPTPPPAGDGLLLSSGVGQTTGLMKGPGTFRSMSLMTGKKPLFSMWQNGWLCPSREEKFFETTFSPLCWSAPLCGL